MPQRWIRALLVLALTCSVLAPSLRAEDGEKEHWYDKLKFSGDFRLRYEGFDWDGQFDDGRRDRFRYRYRLGIAAQITERISAGASVRSGEPLDPVSDNRTFGSGFDKGLVNLAEIWAKIKVNDGIKVTLGKFGPSKLWYVDDMMYDDDVNLEGALEEFDWKFDGTLEKFEINAYQFVGAERSSSSDSYLIGVQAAPTFGFGDANTLTVGLGYETWSNADNLAALSEPFVSAVDPNGVPRLLGNDMTNLVFTNTSGDLVLVSEFDVASAFAIWKNSSSKRWPVQVALFMHQNTGAGDVAGNVAGMDLVNGGMGLGDDNDTAYFARVAVGDYKKKGQVQFRLTRYDADPDAFIYLNAQSDTERGSNLEAWRGDFRVGLPMGSSIHVTYYRSEPKLGFDEEMNRLQVDWQIGF